MKALIGISCCVKNFGSSQLPNHAASDYCVRAIAELSDAIPVLLPAIGGQIAVRHWLERLDGILLTGSPSNVAPCHYDEPQHDSDMLQDPARDATTLPLIRAATRMGMPILAICRGAQELNVALGGSLHQCLEKIPGRLNHAPDFGGDTCVKYQKAHDVSLCDGFLRRMGKCQGAQVNSLHHQAIDRVAACLRVEAFAPDGTIEAVYRRDETSFALGVQWHPEFDCRTDAISRDIFTSFGEAVRAWQQQPGRHQQHWAAD